MAVTNGTPPSKPRGEQPLKGFVQTAFHHDQLADLINLLSNKLKTSARANSQSEDKLTGVERAYFRGALDLARLLWEQRRG
ncbi:MAG: hypothetical protein PHP00_06785 [Thiotrichaceae bacterium]|nr:hypothetical protein [Thiotrichaceae bacterium]